MLLDSDFVDFLKPIKEGKVYTELKRQAKEAGITGKDFSNHFFNRIDKALNPVRLPDIFGKFKVLIVLGLIAIGIIILFAVLK